MQIGNLFLLLSLWICEWNILWNTPIRVFTCAISLFTVSYCIGCSLSWDDHINRIAGKITGWYYALNRIRMLCDVDVGMQSFLLYQFFWMSQNIA